MEAPLPPPPELPQDVTPEKIELPQEEPEQAKKPPKPKLFPISRRGTGSKGQKIQLISNHFKVGFTNTTGHFFQYSISLFYEDGRPVEQKGVGRKVIDKVYETYDSELGNPHYAYDGEKTLFTVGALSRNKLEFTVVLDAISSKIATENGKANGNGSPKEEGDRKRLRRASQSKSFKVEFSFATKIPIQAIASALKGQESENSQEALRVLDVILRQRAAKQGCLLVRQSFFHDNRQNFQDLGGGVLGCRGSHSSFRATQAGLTLNMDGTTTTIIQPGPLVDFLIANQAARDPFQLDWTKAKRSLKNLRIKVTTSNQEYRITGLSEKPCNEQMFTLKSRGGSKDENGDTQEVEMTIYDYFVNHHGRELRYSGDLPCINVGKPKRPTYIPIEYCELVSLQRYTKALTVHQRSSLVEKSRQKPQEKISILTDTMKINNYGAEPMLRACGISIQSEFTRVDGRVLSAPKLKAGNGDEFFARGGRWNFNNKSFVEPAKKISNWAVVNFSARCNVRELVEKLARSAENKGIFMDPPIGVFEENQSLRRAPAPVRVEKMFEQMRPQLPDGPPYFILCLLPERKNCDIYGPWKRKNLAEFGIFNQCLCPPPPNKINEMYLTNVLLKINAKLGGLNSLLCIEPARNIPVVSKEPTMIFGMDVSHGSPGHADVPSIAAVVGSRQWPLISRYRASVRSQSPKVEMIDSLFQPAGEDDNGIVRELLLDFYTSSGQRKPNQIIIFRDGVSESQFNQVLNVELDQIIEACKFLDATWSPKITVIVAQKNHHTKFFQSGGCPDNVPPGTVVDTQVCHPHNFDFFMCPQAGMIGTTRPTHYHVLFDEIGFTADDLQELVHSLSYVYQRSTTAISIVAPVRYAHLAATQISMFLKFDEMSETSSSHGGHTSVGGPPVPELPKLHKTVCSSMFFV